MTRTIPYRQCVASFALVSAIAGAATAQEAGTNVPTQPPTQTPSSLQPQTAATFDVGSPAPAMMAPSNEPVIDAATTQRSFPNRPLLVTGILVLGASYGGAVIVGAISDREADKKLYYPVVGPWMDLRHRGCADNPCDNNTFNRFLIGADGVIQAVGAVSILLSLVLPEKTTRTWYLIGNKDVVVMPQVGYSTLGLAARGAF